MFDFAGDGRFGDADREFLIEALGVILVEEAELTRGVEALTGVGVLVFRAPDCDVTENFVGDGVRSISGDCCCVEA